MHFGLTQETGGQREHQAVFSLLVMVCSNCIVYVHLCVIVQQVQKRFALHVVTIPSDSLIVQQGLVVMVLQPQAMRHPTLGASQPSPASFSHEKPQQGQGSSKHPAPAAHTPNGPQLSYYTEAQPLQDTSNLPQSRTDSVTPSVGSRQQHGVTPQPIPSPAGTNQQAWPKHRQGDVQHQQLQQEHDFGQEPYLRHTIWQPAATDGTLDQSIAAQLLHAMRGGHTGNEPENQSEIPLGHDAFEPAWPKSRNLEEEQQADAAEARLLSIVAQLKSAEEANLSQSQTAVQASSACHHNELPRLFAAW